MTRGSLMLVAIVLARYAATASFAAYSYFQLTVSMLAAYAAMGLGAAASRIFANAEDETDELKESLLGTLWILSMGLAAAWFIVVFAIPEAWLSAGLGVPRWMLALGVLVLAVEVVPGGAILGLERYRHAAVIAALTGGTIVASASVAIHYGRIEIAMLGVVASSLVQAVGETIVVIRAVGWARVARGIPLRRANVVRVLRISGPMFLVSLLSASGGWVVGRAILAGPGGSREFALFTIGLQWFALALVVPGTLSRVLLPRLVRSAGGARGAVASRPLVRTAVLLTTSAAATMATAGVLGGSWILRLYGNQYQEGRWFIAAFLLAAVFSAPANSWGTAILAHDGQWKWLALTGVWWVILVGFAFALRSRGAWAGGATFVIAYGALLCGAFLVASKHDVTQRTG
jgi:O-antigen/teichoic acid export membrane protein